MRGLLLKLQEGWVVEYCADQSLEEYKTLPLDGEGNKLIELWSIDRPLYSLHYQEVEFEIVSKVWLIDEYSHPESYPDPGWEREWKYAKIMYHKKQEQVELPTKEEIEKAAYEGPNVHYQYSWGFLAGVKWILEKLNKGYEKED